MDIPKRLQDLLVREAHLRAGRAAIVPALAEQEAAVTRLAAAKPGIFAPKLEREIHQRELVAGRETLQLLRQGMAQLDRVEPHLHRLVFEAGEDQLRAAYPEYLRALAIRESRKDWANCLQRFGEKVYAFTQALGNVRNMVCSGYKREQQVYSQGAVQAFLLAIGNGRKVEDEIKFANKIADIQEQLLAETGLHATPLPKLREVSYSQWVALISNMALAEAQPQFDQIIGEAKHLYEEGIPELKRQTDLAEANQDQAIDSYVEQYLEAARAAIAPLVNPEETEASVADSEKMLVEMGKQSVLGRLPGVA